MKVNIKAPRHSLLCGEFTGDRWIPRTNGQWRGKCFHLMTSSWYHINIWCLDNLIVDTPHQRCGCNALFGQWSWSDSFNSHMKNNPNVLYRRFFNNTDTGTYVCLKSFMSEQNTPNILDRMLINLLRLKQGLLVQVLWSWDCTYHESWKTNYFLHAKIISWELSTRAINQN